MDNYHITKDGDKWKLKKEGSDRAIAKSDTKEDMIKQMQDYMSNKTGSVKIHKENGQIQSERTYQRKDDPPKSRG